MFFFLSKAAVSYNEDFFEQKYKPTGHREIPTPNGNITLNFWKYSDFSNFSDPYQCAVDPDGACVVWPYYDIPWAIRRIGSNFRYFPIYANAEQISAAIKGISKCSDDTYKEHSTATVTTLTDEQVSKLTCKSVIERNNKKGCFPSTAMYSTPVSEFNKKTETGRNMFPECHDVTSLYPCVVFHPNMKYMSTVVQQSKISQNVYSDLLQVRICKNYADQVYDKCRYAKSISESGLKIQYKDAWTVEPKMGLDDFYKKLQIYWFNQSDPEEMDRPGINCWDPTNTTILQ